MVKASTGGPPGVCALEMQICAAAGWSCISPAFKSFCHRCYVLLKKPIQFLPDMIYYLCLLKIESPIYLWYDDDMRLKVIVACLFVTITALLLRDNLLAERWPVIVEYTPPVVTAASVESMVADSAAAADFPLDLNAATEEELMQIPRIGEVLASRIVQYREHIDGYSNLSQLAQIKGISEDMAEQLGAYLCL